MKRSSSFFISLLTALFLGLSGCVGYMRGSAVAKELRTVHLPAFENGTAYPMAGAIATQQFADALIEDGTFQLSTFEKARVRVQGTITGINTRAVRYDRNHAIVPEEYHLTLVAKFSAYDAESGETLIEDRSVSGATSMLTRGDFQTGVTDALPRAARALAQNLLTELQSIESPSEKERSERKNEH
ncbi:MAG: LPS assembly lipoprotein LptE [Kiritimatiellia bacterium]